MGMDKKTTNKTLSANMEDKRMIEAVQRFHGSTNFSEFTLSLYRAEYVRLGLDKQEDNISYKPFSLKGQEKP